MFCPQCGTSQSDDLRFCKQCGVNLYTVRQAALSRDTPEKFDWSKTWVAEMFMSEAERTRRAEALDRQSGVSPNVKRLKEIEETRYKEIKGGIITSCVGLGVMIFLNVFMRGIIASGIPSEPAQIIGHVWIAGVIPFFVGLGLAFNGLVISKRMVENARHEMESGEAQRRLPVSRGNTDYSSPASNEWTDATSPKYGVTENTTRELK